MKYKALSHYSRLLQIVTFRAGASNGRGTSRKHYSHSWLFRLAPVGRRWSKSAMYNFWFRWISVGVLLGIFGSMVYMTLEAKAQMIDPVVESDKEVYVAYLPLPENEDMWVREYADKYGRTLSERNHTRELLHCLLYNESGYGHNKGHGDGGLAGGPAQFHEATWQRMRKQMLKKGLITEIGSRYDMEQAIQTTAWAIVNGYAKEWGPVLRGYCK